MSASLDQTVRVWDTTGLRKKQLGEPTGGPPMMDSRQSAAGRMTSWSSMFWKDMIGG